MFAILSKCLFLLLVSKFTSAILTESSNVTSNSVLSDSLRGDERKDAETNTTFYYEANAFLINPDSSAKRGQSVRAVSKNEDLAKNKSFVPATIAMTSGRNGRMLDLDSLVGDFAASRANKQRSQTGNRQSRYLSNPSLDVGGGKKLHIQGFIPIVGVKDVIDDGNQENAAESDHDLQSMKQRQRPNELPYEQSSIGHATFGVQRYLNSEQPLVDNNNNNQQIDAKFSGASMIDSLKKPLKRITNYAEAQQHNCLCVPFYMCKNGYISESSLGKSQIQQMIQQQQQQLMSGSLKQSDQTIEMKSSQLMPSSHQAVTESSTQKQPQYADSYVPVDERSLDRELITMATPVENQNQTDYTVNAEITIDNQQQYQNPSSNEDSFSNSTDASLSSDYSQDILGRMLGLKTQSKGSSVSGAGGICGLLRSCCNIPMNLFPSQQDVANEQLMAHHANSVSNSNKYQRQQAASNKQPNFLPPPTDNQQVMALQRYQQQQQQLSNGLNQQQQKMPYGFPMHISRAQTMQPINSFQTSNQLDTSMAHRSNQFQVATRFQQPQVAQYTRAVSVPPMQQLQSYQQQSQIHSLAKVASMPYGLNQQSSIAIQSPAHPLLGTRKILDGRCGLRQSAGITGRVQNLQYHDSSADFGEYPAQAAILKRLGGSDSLFVCGGTLISQYWIATAAHCIKKHALSDLKVRLGEWDVHRDDEFYPHVEKEVRDLVVHPEFVAGNLVNDIALLRLDSPIDPSLPHVNPACLPNIDETFTRQRCWVTGWGKDSFGQKGSFQSVLRKVELPVVGQGECESALRATRLGPHYRLHNGFICAGGEGGRDACEGDGGSGLYCIQDGVIKVVGLVSWGIGCGQAGVPGVYVSLAHYRPWIENIISIDEDLYSPNSNLLGNSLISERSNALNNSTTIDVTTNTTNSTNQADN